MFNREPKFEPVLSMAVDDKGSVQVVMGPTIAHYPEIDSLARKIKRDLGVSPAPVHTVNDLEEILKDTTIDETKPKVDGYTVPFRPATKKPKKED